MSNTPKAARRGLSATVLAALVVVGLVGGVALAAVLSRLNYAGTVNRGAFAVEWTDAASAAATVVDATTGATVSTLTKPTLSGSTMTLAGTTPPELFTGEALRLIASARMTGDTSASKTGYVSGVTAAGLPAGWTARLMAASCGATLDKSGKGVGIELLPSDSAAPAASVDLSAVGLGVTVTGVPNGSVPTGVTCAPVVGK